MEPPPSVAVLKYTSMYILGCKVVRQTCFCFYIEKSLLLIGFKLPNLLRQTLNTLLILLRYLVYFLHGIIDLHSS